MEVTMRSGAFRTALLFACFAATVASHATAGVNRWTRSGPEGGRARSIVVDQSNDRVIYVVVNGIIYKSEDAGGHWRSAHEGITAEIFSMIISSADPAVLYASGLTELL